jgi:ubiquinone/menaquinone biosynthesis C-methylase UbiE
MRLEITNIGKIQKAAVEMRGITVIAGDNNTGKSTYGKVLYCMFNAFCNAESAIQDDNYFDYILASNSLYFVDKDDMFDQTLSEVNRVLKKDGYLISCESQDFRQFYREKHRYARTQ